MFAGVVNGGMVMGGMLICGVLNAPTRIEEMSTGGRLMSGVVTAK